MPFDQRKTFFSWQETQTWLRPLTFRVNRLTSPWLKVLPEQYILRWQRYFPLCYFNHCGEQSHRQCPCPQSPTWLPPEQLDITVSRYFHQYRVTETVTILTNQNNRYCGSHGTFQYRVAQFPLSHPMTVTRTIDITVSRYCPVQSHRDSVHCHPVTTTETIHNTVAAVLFSTLFYTVSTVTQWLPPEQYIIRFPGTVQYRATETVSTVTQWLPPEQYIIR